jgi:hypothetical protein
MEHVARQAGEIAPTDAACATQITTWNFERKCDVSSCVDCFCSKHQVMSANAFCSEHPKRTTFFTETEGKKRKRSTEGQLRRTAKQLGRYGHGVRTVSSSCRGGFHGLLHVAMQPETELFFMSLRVVFVILCHSLSVFNICCPSWSSWSENERVELEVEPKNWRLELNVKRKWKTWDIVRRPVTLGVTSGVLEYPRVKSCEAQEAIGRIALEGALEALQRDGKARVMPKVFGCSWLSETIFWTFLHL